MLDVMNSLICRACVTEMCAVCILCVMRLTWPVCLDNIETALSGYFKRESLGQGENMYKCERCRQKVTYFKTILRPGF